MKDFSKGTKILSPAGVFSFPSLWLPKANTLKNNKLEYRTDLLIPYELPEDPNHSKNLEKFFTAIQNVGAAKFGGEYTWASACDNGVLERFGVGTPGLQQEHACIKDLRSSVGERVTKKTRLGDVDGADKASSILDRVKDSFVIKAWTNAGTEKKSVEDCRPSVYGPTIGADGRRRELNDAQIQDISGGDWGKIAVNVRPYVHQSGTWGVTFFLEDVQFWKKGEPLGQGGTDSVELMEDLVVPIEDTSLFEESPTVGAPSFIKNTPMPF